MHKTVNYGWGVTLRIPIKRVQSHNTNIKNKRKILLNNHVKEKQIVPRLLEMGYNLLQH